MKQLKQRLQEGIDNHAAPCYALFAQRHDDAFTLICGNHTYEPEAPALKQDDFFDLASMTKIIATTSLAILRVQQQKLKLDDPLDTYIRERKNTATMQPTIRQILAHCAGFPPFLPFYKTLRHITEPDAQRAYIATIQPTCQPGTQTEYSDIGFMLLGLVLERLDGRPLPVQAKEDVFIPLGMNNTFFNPPESLKSRCVPTELLPDSNPPTPCQGVVHDENARWMHGETGHAGLFSTLHDVAQFANVFRKNDGHFFSQDLVRLFTTTANLTPDSTRCLGWDSPSPIDETTGVRNSSAGNLASQQAFGHTGFTGTSFWIDPVNDCTVVLLTNAVHPRRECKKNYFPWRNHIHTLACKALGM